MISIEVQGRLEGDEKVRGVERDKRELKREAGQHQCSQDIPMRKQNQ